MQNPTKAIWDLTLKKLFSTWSEVESEPRRSLVSLPGTKVPCQSSVP